MGPGTRPTWLARHGPDLLAGVGIVVIVFGFAVAFVGPPGLGLGAVTFGGLLAAFAVAMLRMEGSFKLSKDSLEGSLLRQADLLKQVEKEADEEGLPAEERERAIESARELVPDDAQIVVSKAGLARATSGGASVEVEAAADREEEKPRLSDLIRARTYRLPPVPAEELQRVAKQLNERLAEAIIRSTATCGECGSEIPLGHDLPERRPCPHCGSKKRRFSRVIADRL